MDQSGKWSLSPGYDICHAYRPGSMWVSAQSLMVNGKREGISDADFLEVARKMNIKKPEEKIEQVKISVQRWIELAKETGVEVKLRDSIQATLLV
jgi:serine/threonine-protein kinase HipA